MTTRIATLASLLLLALQAAAIWPFGESQEEKDRRDEKEIIALLREPNRLMNEAQDDESEGRPERAIEKYREALDQLKAIEKARDTSSEHYAPLRFKKALCETMIDRIIFDKAEKNQRSVTMSNTTALEAQLAKERAAKNPPKPAKQAPPAVTNIPPKAQSPVQTNTPPKAAATPPPPPEKPKPKPHQLLRFARDMLEDGDDKTCEKTLLELLEAYPDHIGGLQLLCLLRLEQNRREDAIAAIEHALELFPDDEPSAMLGAAAATAVGNFPRAIELLDRVLKNRPTDPAPYYNMALTLLEMRTGETLKAAEKYYRKSVERGGKRDSRVERRLGIEQN
ncbi:MAG: tetratricopeptide repeat protein [Kiritimatiellia bacterium]|nr:tetratricopeptide repeat protein [Kiritimatiellia bacterium]